MTEQHGVYRFYDENDTLLYVGCSLNPFSRFMSHRDKPRHLIRHIEIEWFENRNMAESAEAVAIRREKPLWNKVQPKRALRMSPTHLGKHFGYAPEEYEPGFAGVDHWFHSETSPFSRVLKVCRPGDVIHVHPDIDVPEDVARDVVKKSVHLWRHPESDFQQQEQG